ncbi:MAG: LTA synthase family protein [Firmicutes bacterium]|nr:LTA synthase family protein [Bacillota bacterium]
MKQKKRLGISRFVIFAAAFIYLEIVFQFFMFQSPTWGMLYGALFGLPLAFLCALLTGLGPKWLNKILTTIILIFISVLFIAQMVYYDIFRTFLQVFSITKGAGAAVDFISVVINSLLKNWGKLLLLLLPLIAYFAWPFWGGHGDFSRDGWKVSLGLLVATLLFHGLALLVLLVPGTGTRTPYDQYHNKPAIQICIRNIGVLPTMRREAERMLLGSSGGGLTLSGNSKKENSSKQESSIEESSVEESRIEESSREESSIAESSMEESSVEEVFVPQPNVLEIDFDKLISEAPNDTVAVMHEYFQSQEPTYTNEYTGMFEGYNLIWVLAESFSSWIIDEELTPTLYKMANSGFVFNNFYTPYYAYSTIDGEFVTHTSLLPREDIWSFYHSADIEMPFGFGNMFAGLGYSARAYHNHDYDFYNREYSHPNIGYVWKGLGNGMYVTPGVFPASDQQMMELALPEFIDEEPFHAYFLTISGHTMWNFNGENAMCVKNEAQVQDLPYGTQLRAYIACQLEVEYAMTYLLEQLEAAGIADRTVIAFSADHYPYALSDWELSELKGSDVTVDFDLYENCFMIYCPGMEETVQIDKVGSSLDIAPTLANLFNLPFDSRLYMGTDLLSDSEATVIFSDHSFLTDKMQYNASTGEVKFFGEELSDSYVEEMIDKVEDKFTMSSAIIDTDYYSYLTEYLSWWDGETYGHLYDPATEDPIAEENTGGTE